METREVSRTERQATALHGADRPTTVDRVVAVLRQAMFDGALMPGEPLREIPLSQKLRVGRSTIREALRALATDGLVARMPNRGLVVRQLTMAEVEDIFTARHLLELGAAQAAATCPQAALDALRAAFEAYETAVAAADIPRMAQAHAEFHATMVGITGSLRLAEAERSLMRDVQLALANLDGAGDELPREIENHREILRLVCRRDAAALTRYLQVDLERARQFVLSSATDAPGRP
jgi:DNA-binding GntR family transcriptional regulator